MSETANEQLGRATMYCYLIYARFWHRWRNAHFILRGNLPVCHSKLKKQCKKIIVSRAIACALLPHRASVKVETFLDDPRHAGIVFLASLIYVVLKVHCSAVIIIPLPTA